MLKFGMVRFSIFFHVESVLTICELFRTVSCIVVFIEGVINS